MLSKRQEEFLIESGEVKSNGVKFLKKFLKNILPSSLKDYISEFQTDGENLRLINIYNRQCFCILSVLIKKQSIPYRTMFDKQYVAEIHINDREIRVCFDNSLQMERSRVSTNNHCPNEIAMIVNALYKSEKNCSVDLYPIARHTLNRYIASSGDKIAIWFLRDIMWRFAASVDTRFTVC